MKARAYFKTICLMIILTGVLIVSMSVTAQTLKQMTPLEKKLYEGALKEGQLEWWDSQSLKESAAYIKEFSSLYPGIKVNFFEASSDVRDEKYLAEFEAGRKTLDTTSVDQYKRFKEKGLLEDINDIIKDTNYPVEYCSKDFLSTSVEHALNGTAYNTKLISPKDVPKSYEDLLDPKWKGKIAIEQRLKFFLYNTPIWGETKTVNYLKRLREQKPIMARGNSNMLSLLAVGEFPIAMSTVLNLITGLKLKGAPVEWLPANPTPDKLSSFVVMHHAPHPNAAKLFLRWLMTPEGQMCVDKVYFKGTPRRGSGTIQAKTAEKYGLEVIPVSVAEMADEFDKLEKIYDEALGIKIK